MTDVLAIDGGVPVRERMLPYSHQSIETQDIDAVIAALLLKMMWKPYRAGTFSEASLEIAAFTVFLYGRMIGCAAEIDDHLNRGRNMDTRTAASECRFVA